MLDIQKTMENIMNKILFKARLENRMNLIKGVWNSFAPTCLIIPRRIDAHLAMMDEIYKILEEEKRRRKSE